jgi:hypothetical protein
MAQRAGRRLCPCASLPPASSRSLAGLLVVLPPGTISLSTGHPCVVWGVPGRREPAPHVHGGGPRLCYRRMELADKTILLFGARDNGENLALLDLGNSACISVARYLKRWAGLSSLWVCAPCCTPLLLEGRDYTSYLPIIKLSRAELCIGRLPVT